MTSAPTVQKPVNSAATIKKTKATRKRWSFKPVSTGRKRKLLQAYAQCGMVTYACRITKIAHQEHYRWLKTDPQYREDVEVIENMRISRADDALWRRGVLGTKRKVGWYKGEPGGDERVYDTDAAKTWLRANSTQYAKQDEPRISINVTVDEAKQRMAALLERNPDLLKQLQVIQQKTIEGGVGPPSEAVKGGQVAHQCSSEDSSENNHGAKTDL